MLAYTSLNHLFGQQTQAPAGVAFWRIRAGECGDFGTLGTINFTTVQTLYVNRANRTNE